MSKHRVVTGQTDRQSDRHRQTDGRCWDVNDMDTWTMDEPAQLCVGDTNL